MTLNLKALGLALFAVFAMSAVAASTASAQNAKITTDGESVTLTGTETGEPLANSFTAFGQTLRCPGSTFTGHKFETTPHVPVPNNAENVTITPTYVNCVDQNEKPLTVSMNGCDYEFRHATTKNPNENTYTVTVYIVCSAGQIEIKGGFCTVKVPAQGEKSGFHLKEHTGIGRNKRRSRPDRYGCGHSNGMRGTASHHRCHTAR